MEGTAQLVDVAHIFYILLVVLIAAKLAGELFERIGQPAVLGELVAGMILGGSALGVVPVDPSDPYGSIVHVLAEIGVAILLFEIGLETDLREMFRVGSAAVTVAVVGVVLPFAFGYLFWVLYVGGASLVAIFVGATLTATSVGITARVLADIGKIHTAEARIIIGAAVIDDVLGLLILATVEGLAETGQVAPAGIAKLFGLAFGFLAVAMAVGLLTARPLFELVNKMRVRGVLVTVALAFALLLAYLADGVGLAPIVGSFAAGLILSRTNQFDVIVERIKPVADVFTPIFFVSVGAAVDITILDPRDSANHGVLLIGGALFIIAVMGKVVSGFAVFWRKINRLAVGMGMVPRGEVGLIFAQLGLLSGILSRDVFSAILIMVMGTTLMTPPLLKPLFQRSE
ncbi:MAG TPA: cation:proton antiporter [Gemmatimonadota bacterium]|jgi:Kef-type K+ transport system membrane component KefB|nr:cation:proton antiporter [Gemmatimonadota bacterium]